MNATDIAFPHLGIYLENVPKSVSVFGFSISLYGIIIATGMFLGILLVAHEARISGQTPEVYWEFALYAVMFSVVGARAYYVIFSWENYRNNPWEIFNIRGGGMAIYGAVIAAFITLFMYCRRKKYSARLLGDTSVPGLLLGQVIGRFGNFVNREAFGEYTDTLFAMQLPISAVREGDITELMWEHMAEGANVILVHPTFLYESAWNLVLLCIVLFVRRKKYVVGEICLLYLGGYGAGRFLIERLRTDQLLLPGTELAVSQILSLGLVILAVVCEVFVKNRESIIFLKKK